MKKAFLTRTISVFFAFLLVFTVGMPIALAASEPTITVGSVNGKPGDVVSVPITIANNPGIVALRIFVEYDAEILQLNDVQDGTIFPANKSTFNDNLQANPFTMLWADGTSTTNYTANGTLATLTFTILGSAKDGSSTITLTYDSSSTFNVDLTDVPFTMQNGNVTVAKDEILYTATFMVNGIAVSTKQYHENDTIEKPDDPAKDGFVFTGWDPAVPATMPAHDITFTAAFEKDLPPTIAIRNYKANITVDYRTTITFAAIVENAVDGAEIHWFVDGKDVGTGETYEVEEARSAYLIQVKYVKNGTAVAESLVETVSVKTGFFARLIAFFRALFGRLPKKVQEVYGLNRLLNILP